MKKNRFGGNCSCPYRYTRPWVFLKDRGNPQRTSQDSPISVQNLCR